MSFEEFQNLNREERLRAQLDELALVGATQIGVSHEDAAIASGIPSRATLKHREYIAKEFSVVQAKKISVQAKKILVQQILQETHVGEATVLKIIDSYERTAVKAAG